MEVSEVLNAAADLLRAPGAWTTGTCAKTSYGYSTGPEDKDAACWCGIGAVRSVCRKGSPYYGLEGAACAALHAMAKAKGYMSFGRFNDDPDRTQAEVVESLRQASAKATGGDHAA